jgi:hypothetical protein
VITSDFTPDYGKHGRRLWQDLGYEDRLMPLLQSRRGPVIKGLIDGGAALNGSRH